MYARYEVLADPEKRSIYDARGEAGLSEQGGMGGMDPQVSHIFPSSPSLKSAPVHILGSLQPTLWRRWLLWWRWRPFARHSQDQRSRSPSPGVARGPLQGQDHQTRSHAKRPLFKVQWKGWERGCRSHVWRVQWSWYQGHPPPNGPHDPTNSVWM